MPGLKEEAGAGDFSTGTKAEESGPWEDSWGPDNTGEGPTFMLGCLEALRLLCPLPKALCLGPGWLYCWSSCYIASSNQEMPHYGTAGLIPWRPTGHSLALWGRWEPSWLLVYFPRSRCPDQVTGRPHVLGRWWMLRQKPGQVIALAMIIFSIHGGPCARCWDKYLHKLAYLTSQLPKELFILWFLL